MANTSFPHKLVFLGAIGVVGGLFKRGAQREVGYLPSCWELSWVLYFFPCLSQHPGRADGDMAIS